MKDVENQVYSTVTFPLEERSAIDPTPQLIFIMRTDTSLTPTLPLFSQPLLITELWTRWVIQLTQKGHSYDKIQNRNIISKNPSSCYKATEKDKSVYPNYTVKLDDTMWRWYSQL